MNQKWIGFLTNLLQTEQYWKFAVNLGLNKINSIYSLNKLGMFSYQFDESKYWQILLKIDFPLLLKRGLKHSQEQSSALILSWSNKNVCVACAKNNTVMDQLLKNVVPFANQTVISKSTCTIFLRVQNVWSFVHETLRWTVRGTCHSIQVHPDWEWSVQYLNLLNMCLDRWIKNTKQYLIQ